MPARLAAGLTGAWMTEVEEDKTTSDKEVRIELAKLRQEHRDLDAAIQALERSGNADSLQVQRLKKRKLVLKDRIGFLEDQVVPDIIA